MKNLKMLIFLMVLSTICVLLLGGATLLYRQASSIFNVRLYAVILDLFNIETTEDNVREVFLDNFEIQTIGDRTYYTAKNTDKGVRVFTASGPGLWSTIEILLAVDSNFEKLYGLRVISQAETPGLGGRIAEKQFQERFKDVEVQPSLRIVKFASAPNEVDAVTGASKTSEALEEIINKALEEAAQALKGAK